MPNGIGVTNKKISLERQAQLLGISRASLYYHPKENTDKDIMDKIDCIYTDYPFYGSRRMKWELIDRYKIHICREHIQRLMRQMGITAIYPKKNLQTSRRNKEHVTYPYLLRNKTITTPNQVWGTDITYVRLEHGFAYVVAIIDWYSRYVLSWRISLSMETAFCCEALLAALQIGKPLIHNSDQGAQFTDRDYVGLLTENHIAVSMDGRGRCMDNIFTERLWRTVKQEDIYIRGYRTISDAREGLEKYFLFYNTKRRHQSLDYQTPENVYKSIQ